MALARPTSLRHAEPSAAADDDLDGGQPAQGCRIPTDEQIAEMLTALLGREVSCHWSPGTHQLPDAGRVAVYRDDAEIPVAVAVADVAFICRTGGALVMVPTKGVQENVEQGEIPDQLGDNFGEVVNIMASLLNSDDTPHVRLTTIHGRDERSDDPRAESILAEPSRRRVFDVSVEDYGRGRIVFLFP